MLSMQFPLVISRTRPKPLFCAPPLSPSGRPPRLARLLALAHKLDGLVRAGTIKTYRELAELGAISSARLSQILLLLNLAPPIQEYILFLSPGEGAFITEVDLRKIAREPLWHQQIAAFNRCLGRELGELREL